MKWYWAALITAVVYVGIPVVLEVNRVHTAGSARSTVVLIDGGVIDNIDSWADGLSRDSSSLTSLVSLQKKMYICPDVEFGGYSDFKADAGWIVVCPSGHHLKDGGYAYVVPHQGEDGGDCWGVIHGIVEDAK